MEFKGTSGTWYWEEGFDTEMGSIKSTNGTKVCDFGNEEQYYPVEGTEPNEYDRLLMVKAPEMLDALKYLFNKANKPVNRHSVNAEYYDKYFEIEQLIKQATTL